jgi:phosphate transport system substrate-binding protein
MAGRIKVSDASIGYVEHHFGKRLGLSMAISEQRLDASSPRRRSGRAALAANVKQIPSNLRLVPPFRWR